MISSSPPRCFWMEVFCGYPMPVLSLYILGVGKHVLITHLLGVQVFRWGTRPKEPYPRNCTEAALSGPGFDLYDKILDFWVNTEMELDFRGFREQAVFCSWEECKIVVTRGKLWQVLFSKDSCTSVSCPPCSATERSCHTPKKRQSLCFYNDEPWHASVIIHRAGLLRILSIWELMSFSSEKFSFIFFLALIFSVLSNILSTCIYAHRYVVLYQWFYTIHAVLYKILFSRLYRLYIF